MQEKTLEQLEEYVNKLSLEAKKGEINDEEKSIAHRRYLEAMTTLKEVEEVQLNAYDKDEKRRIEEKKNDDAKEVELTKQNMGWKRTALEVGKIVVPVITACLAAVTAVKMQDRSGHLEESGRWTTECARMAHNQIPRIWNS